MLLNIFCQRKTQVDLRIILLSHVLILPLVFTVFFGGGIEMLGGQFIERFNCCGSWSDVVPGLDQWNCIECGLMIRIDQWGF